MTAAVETNPGGRAVVFADANATSGELSYAELDERSTRLARLLIDRGVGPEDLVAVAVPRSVDSVLAVWAVAKTGAGFVPVDPHYPADRVAHMLTDSGVSFGLTVASVHRGLPDDAEWLLLDDPSTAQLLQRYPADRVTNQDRVRPLHGAHPAYVIYTSGSTGAPKGVVVTHQGLSGFCDEQRTRFRVTSAARTLHFASPSFDASVLELLLALGGAATMVVVAPTVYGGAELAAVLRRERVTHAFVTPAALASVEPAGLDELRVVVTGGEVCPPQLVRRWVLPIAGGLLREFFNAYGPTEATIATTITAPMVPWEPVTLGPPIHGIAAHVLNDRLMPVPNRVVGELYLAGAPLARGYLGQQTLTAARFVANPFEPGTRLYRTGDLVRWTATGELEYLGRNDSQVKIRGFRIELTEIDAVLGAYDRVDFAVTVGHELDSGTTALASYVHPVDGRTVDVAELNALVERKLPAHMVPACITVLDKVPLTPTGKLDRKALPAPVFEAKGLRAPATPVGEIVAGTFGDVLGVERVGLDDDFFELGGNSLLATQVTARLDAALDTQLAIRDLFHASTVAAFTAVVERTAGSGRSRPRLVAGERPELIPLSLAQQRYWFLNQFDTETSAVDNIPLAVRLTGDLDATVLGLAIGDVLSRHEVLRTTYPSSNGRPHQVIHRVPEARFAMVPVDVAEGELVQRITEFAMLTFDVTVEVPVAVALFRLTPHEHVIALTVHHVAADGASMSPLARDLMVAYAARMHGQAPPWQPLPVQYADYALWEREILGDEHDPESPAAQQIAYWRRTLAGLPDQLTLPTDRPRPPARSFQSRSVRFEISADRHTRLHALARANRASLFMVVHAALAVLLARLSGTDDIAVGTPIAGRGEPELDDLIGMFVNTLVFRTRVRPSDTFAAMLADVRERDLEAFAHADVPFERIVEALNPVRSLAHNPLFQVGLSFQNMAETTVELPGLSVATVDFELQLAKTDLHISLADRYTDDGAPAGMVADFGYATDLFDEPTVRGFADRFVRVLDAVLADPAVRVGEIELLDGAESARMPADRDDTAHPIDATTTPAEDIVAGVFGDVLGVQRVGRDDDFLAMGGNSLLATQVAARIGDALDTVVPVRSIFETPTVAGLAAEVETHAGSGRRQPLLAGPRPEQVPLSPAQLRMWFINQFDTGSAAYHLPVAIRLSGELDIAALGSAVEDVVARHEVLRTVYPQTSEGPVQEVLAPNEVAIDLVPMPIAESDAMQQVREFAAAGFDVTAEVPFRATLFRLDTGDHLLVFVAHHIGADGWSMTPLVRDVMLAYSARSVGELPAWAPLPVQYADFSVWQRTVLGSEDDPESLIAAQAEYWRTALADLPDELNLPADRPRPALRTSTGGRTEFEIDPLVHTGLIRLARRHNVTMFMVVHAALSVFLARMSGTDDIAIGTPVAGRDAAELDDMIGMFVNTLVLRLRVPDDRSFGELLADAKDTDLQAFSHAALPFERLVGLLNPPRSTARHPLFQVSMSYLNLPANSFELPGLQAEIFDFAIDTAKFDLSLTMWAPGTTEDGLRGEFTFARDLFDDKTIEMFAARFTRLLTEIVARPDAAIGDLSLLGAAEEQALTPVRRGATPAVRLLPDLLTSAVSVDPEHVAVRTAGRSISYRELDEYSSRLARVLIDRGVGPQTLVALAFPRSLEMVAAFWAVAKAGGAHVPIDPAYPADRIRHMVTDSGAVLGITTSTYTERLPDGATETGWLQLDDPAIHAAVAAKSPSPITDAERLATLLPQHPAYVIYTSGSTGTPKGVTVTHVGIGGAVEAASAVFQLGPQHRFLHLCSPSFDPSILEWLCTFHNGATLVIVPSAILGGPELTALLRTERVTHAIFTPAVLGTVEPAGLDDLRFLCCCGDSTSPDLVAKWQPGRHFINGYGPAEATVAASWSEMIAGQRITMGGPVPGTPMVVLDSLLRPVPPGAVGELYLAGTLLARGYHNRPTLTAERFVADPWGPPGARLYRTGDLVRWVGEAAEWELEYVGRTDFQLEIRGLRIELGEIDAVFASHDDVEFAVTIGRETPTGDKILVAYVLAVAGRTIDTGALTEYAARSLPRHMVPSAVVVLDEVPVTPVGKLDRAALPAPELAPRPYLVPSTAQEQAVAGVYAETLGVDRVGSDDDFFALGGSSLAAMRAVHKLRELTGIAVQVQWFFTDPTVAALTQRIMAADDTEAHDYGLDAEAALDVLLPIRQGTGEALFCIHPMAGLSWCYTGLTQYLPADRPIFGVQSPALSESDFLPDSLDAMARRYVEEIRAVQPEGPYRVLGWSLGGALAHAVAVELQSAGAEVALLAMLDSRTGGNIADFWGELRATFAELGIGPDTLGDTNIRNLTEEALAVLYAGIPPELALLTPQRLRQSYRGAVRSVELGINHQHKVFHGTLDFFSASGHTAESRAWRPYVDGSINEHPVEATHELMTSPAALAEIGPILAALLVDQPESPVQQAAAPTEAEAFAPVEYEYPAPRGYQYAAPLDEPAAFDHEYPTSVLVPIRIDTPAPTDDLPPMVEAPVLELDADEPELADEPEHVDESQLADEPEHIPFAVIHDDPIELAVAHRPDEPDDAPIPLSLTPNAVRLLDSGVELRVVTLEIPPNYSPEAVQFAVDTVLEQHPMLWVRLHRDGAGTDPVFEIPAEAQRLDEAFLGLEYGIDQTPPPVDDVVRAVATELDPAHGRNIRFVLVGGREVPSTMVIVANGLVVDDTSWRTIIDKLSLAWSRGRHRTPAVPEAGLSALLRALSEGASGPAAIEEVAWWHHTLSAVPATKAGAMNANLHLRRRVSLTITTEGTAAVVAAAGAHGASVDEVLLAALAIAQITAAGETVTEAIGPVVRLHADSRTMTETNTLVGAFTTDYPLPLKLEGVNIQEALVGGRAAGVAIEQVKRLTGAVPSGGVGYGLLRYLNPDTAAALTALPAGRCALRYRDLRPARVHIDAPAADLLLDITADATADGLLMRFDYAAEVFGGDEVKTFAEHWIRALGGLAEHGQRVRVH
ncbi:amino acid adenylation domain-containing protein [Nocardia sp. NPDC051990]|uniref:amino acid adenylation domain-containing protein n=1 Tax=Nocardia sp. NPDC051990 TaxID=3155285 RepID=UPI00343880CD